MVEHSELFAFRFHTGSIKSVDLLLRMVGLNPVFRFHTGSIKSDDRMLIFLRLQKFRFHTGSIKSRLRVSGIRLNSVSIPYWFD